MTSILRLDDKFHRDHLVQALGLLLVASVGVILTPRMLSGAEISFVILYVLTGIFFIHQFGLRGAPLAIGFLTIAVVAGVLGRPLGQAAGMAAAGALAAGFVAFYSAWVQDIQAMQDHRLSVESEMSSKADEAKAGVGALADKLRSQELRLKTWTSLVDVVRGCSSTLKFDGLCEFVLSTVESLFPDDRVSLWIGSASSGRVGVSAAGRRYQHRPNEPTAPDGLDCIAVDRKQNILVVDRAKDSRFQMEGSPGEGSHVGSYRFSGRSAIVCPLLEENEVFGHLRVTSLVPERFNHEDMVILSHIAGVVSMSASNVRLYERTEQLALTDGQTGLFKRYYFEKRFAEESRRARRKTISLALILVDIDHFKRVNDTYGHAAGDRVLQQVGRLIREVDWAGPLPCRWGGEEFILVLPDATPAQAQARAKSLAEHIRSVPFKADESAAGDAPPKDAFFVTVSMGISSFPGDTGDPEQLFQISDRRLYAAKNSGRDRIVDSD